MRLSRLPPRAEVHVVTAENMPDYRGLISEQRRLRRESRKGVGRRLVLGEHLAEPLRTIERSRAVRLLGIEAGSTRILGIARLAPTTFADGPAPPLEELADHFPPPRSPYVFHWSRLEVYVAGSEAQATNHALGTMLAGVQAFALKENIEQLTAVVDLAWLATLLELALNPMPLGLPRERDGRSALAVTVDITEVALRRTRSLYAIACPAIVQRGITSQHTPPLARPRLHS